LKLVEYIPLVLLGVLLFALIARRCWSLFPWFFTYAVFAVCAGLARFITRNQTHAYFWTYWITEALYDLLGVCVMYEVSRRVFGNIGRSWWPRLLFPGMVVVSVVLTVGRGTSSPSGLHNRAMVLIILGEIFIRFLEVIMFATLVTLVPVLGLQWRQYAFGVATGFGVYSIVALLTTTRFSVLGLNYYFSWALALIISYSCSVLIWLFFFSAPEKTVPPHGPSLLSFEELNVYRKLLRRINR
jgi:hypothetical protein